MSKRIKTYTTYEASAVIAAVAAGDFICGLSLPYVVGPQNVVMGLTRLTVVLTTAVASEFGLALAQTPGTPTAPGTHLGKIASLNNGGYAPLFPNVQGGLFTAWSAVPTTAAPATYYRQELLPNIIGSGFEWTWPDDDPFTTEYQVGPTYVAPGVLLQNTGVGASGTMLVSARWMQFNPLST